MMKLTKAQARALAERISLELSEKREKDSEEYKKGLGKKEIDEQSEKFMQVFNDIFSLESVRNSTLKISVHFEEIYGNYEADDAEQLKDRIKDLIIKNKLDAKHGNRTSIWDIEKEIMIQSITCTNLTELMSKITF